MRSSPAMTAMTAATHCSTTAIVSVTGRFMGVTLRVGAAR